MATPGVNLYDAVDWESRRVVEAKNPSAPDYLFGPSGGDYLDASGFPRDLAPATAKKVFRAVVDVIDCRPDTIEEAQNVL